MRSRGYFLVTLRRGLQLAAFLVWSHVGYADDASDRIARFKTEAAAAWNEALEWTVHTKASYEDRATWSKANAPKAVFQGEYILAGTNFAHQLGTTAESKSSYLDGKGDVDRSATGRNRVYSFSLLRNRTSRQWLITNLYEENDVPPIDSEYSVLMSNYARRCMAVQDFSLPKLLSDSSFHIRSVSEPDSSGLVQVNCYQSPADESTMDRLDDADIWLNPSRSWTLAKYSASMTFRGDPSASRIDAVYEYFDSDRPLLKRYRETVKGPDGHLFDHEVVFSIHERWDSIADGGEFRLTAFGLPEIGLSSRPSDFYWWLAIVAGVGCLGFGAWLAKRA